MIHLGLTSDEARAFGATLTQSHKIRLDVALLDQDENEISNLSAPINRVLTGAVQVDSTAAITRSLSLTLLDPRHKLRFEANSPAHGSIYADRFVAVRYEVYVPATLTDSQGETITGIGDWVSVPVFWGPLSNYERNGAEVSIEAQGKESLMLNPYFATQPYTVHKGTRLDDAIQDIAGRAGETRFSLPDLPDKLGRARVVHSNAEPWLALTNSKTVSGVVSSKSVRGHVTSGRDKGAVSFTNELGKVPGLIDTIAGHYGGFYDGRGRLCVRKLNRQSVHTFTDGRDLIAGSPPQVSYDITAFRNYVRVTGGKPKGKPSAVGHAALPPANPLSPDALARNGKNRYMTEFITADNLKTDDECEAHAHEVLERLAMQGVDISFTCLPLPMLEENDVVTLRTEDFTYDFQVKSFSIPLTSDTAMTIGRHQKVSVGRRKTKKWHHHLHGGAGPGGHGSSGGKPGGGKHRHHHKHHHHGN